MTTPETVPAPLILALFGPMQAVVAGQPLPRLRSRKTLWALALLALRPGRPVERQWLAGTLWPDVDQDQAFANLRPVLSELRQALGDQAGRLQSPSRHTLLFDLAGADVDVHVFDAAVASGEHSALERAVALYRGPLLEGCAEEWVYQERAARERGCLQALRTLADSEDAAGDCGAAAGYYRQALEIDPLWDAARRGLMAALAKGGDANAAMHVYREFVDLLKSDPKAVPDEATSALYAQVRAEARRLAAAPAPAAAKATLPRPGNLPNPVTELIGREDERSEAIARLRRSRLVTLTGVGGIGKTRLAIETAAGIASEYADGVWFVTLEALTDGTLVASQIASVLGVREEAGQTPLQTLTRFLKEKCLLLVLDNCEHLLEESARPIEHLLRECGEIRILATSREALAVAGEAAWTVPALEAPDPQHLPKGRATLQRVLLGYESVQLFAQRALAVNQAFSLTAGNAHAVAQICFQLEGIPLAIELAAARMNVMTADQIATRLHDHLKLLTGGSRTALSRQQTLKATLEWSYTLIGEPERMLLRRLSVFMGGWGPDVPARVCAGERIDPLQIPGLLDSLRDRSLVVFEEREGEPGGRYRLLEMVRQYAFEQLRASGELNSVRAEQCAWLVALAEEAETHLRGADQVTWLRKLERETANFRAAMGWLREQPGRVETFLRLTGALGQFWYIRADCQEGRRHLESALAREDAGAVTAVRAKALNRAGLVCYRLADFPESRARYEESLAIYRQLGDRLGTAVTLNNLGNLLYALGDHAVVQALYEESLSIRREIGDRRGIADSLGNLANLAHIQSDYQKARGLFEEATGIFRELGDKRALAITLDNLGNVAYAQTEFEEARRLHEDGVAVLRELGDRGGAAHALQKLGSVFLRQGDMETARSLYEESREILREMGDRRGVAFSILNLGTLYSNRGDNALAQEYLEECLKAFRELRDRFGVANSLSNLGVLAERRGDYAEARSLQEEALGIRRELGDRRGIATGLSYLADVARLTGDLAEAWALYAEAIPMFQEQGGRWAVARGLTAMAVVILERGDARKAVRLWSISYAHYDAMGAPLPPSVKGDYDGRIEQARSLLGAEAFNDAWDRGRAMTLDEAVADALEKMGEQTVADVLAPPHSELCG